MPTDRELLDQLAMEYADYKSKTQQQLKDLYEQIKSSQTEGSASGEAESVDLREAGGEEDLGLFGLSEAVLY